MSEQTSARTVLLVASVSSFLTPFMGSSTNVALPAIGHDLRLGAVALGWVATAYLLAASVFLLPLGRWADIHGRKRTFVWGLVVYAAGSLLSGLAPSGAALLAFRGLQGLGGAMIFGTGVAILTSAIPAAERGRALGINVAAVYCGLAAGPFVGGLLTEHLGWRSVFLSNAPIAVLTAVLAALKLRGEWAEARGERFDGTGAVLYGVALAALMYGLSEVPSVMGAVLAGVGAVGLLLFALWETRSPMPLLDVRLLLGNGVFAYSNLAALINYSSTAGSGFLLSLYLQSVQGFSPREAGTILLTQPVIQAAISPLAGRLSDRLEPRVLASAGMGVTAVGLALLNTLGERTALGAVVACLVLLGFGFALFSSPNTNAVMSSVQKRLYGVASGTLATMRLTGQMLSMGLVMLLLSVFMGDVEVTPESAASFLQTAHVAFVLFAALCAAGVLASLARGKVRALSPPD
jgi:EmrB/QacA subfamily drug resistance transporter